MLHDGEQVDEWGHEWVDRPLHPRHHRTEARLSLALALTHGKAGDILKARMLVDHADDGANQCDLIERAGHPGEQSPIWTPGTRVAIGWNSPRIPAGA